MKVDSPRLKYLLERYTRNTCNEAERQELMHMIQQAGYEDDVKGFLKQEIIAGSSDSLITYPALSPQKADSLFKIIIGGKEKAGSKIYFRRIAAAAAILLAIAGTLAYFLMTHSNKNEGIIASLKVTPTPVYKALPGRQGAILTLSNGQQIILDSAANGKLTSQGSIIVSNKNGQIVYDGPKNNEVEMLYNTMTTAKGRQYQLVLSDGTRVWLNSASSINYPVAFADSARTVSITGEVYFEVAKNHRIPFIVNVNNMKVKVMGTHFNVNAYHDEESVKTTLLEGSVVVSATGNSTVLAPGQQSRVYKTGNLKVIKNADLEEAVAWKDGVFLFNKADIQSVMRKIARWYDLEIAYEGDIPGDKFGGKLPMDATISQVLGALEQTQVHFKMEGKKIIVMP